MSTSSHAFVSTIYVSEMAISTSLTEHQQLPGEIEGRYRYGKKQWDVANEFVGFNKNVAKAYDCKREKRQPG